MPNASSEEREAARENLRQLVLVLLRIDERLHRDAVEGQIRENVAAPVESESGPYDPSL